MSENETTGDSRRSFMAKGALATGALTLGTGAFGTATVGAQVDRVAVFANNFFPGSEFNVIARLEAGTTVEVLQLEGETVPEISQPDEWAGHVIRYDIGQQAGVTAFLFVRGQSLSEGESGTMGEEASVLNSELNLLNTSLGGGGDTGGEPIEEEEEVIEEDTTETETETETQDEPSPIEENETTTQSGGA